MNGWDYLGLKVWPKWIHYLATIGTMLEFEVKPVVGNAKCPDTVTGNDTSFAGGKVVGETQFSFEDDMIASLLAAAIAAENDAKSKLDPECCALAQRISGETRVRVTYSTDGTSIMKEKEWVNAL